MVEFILGGVDQHSLDVFLEVLRASGSNEIRRRMGQMTDGSFSKLKDQLPVTDSVLRTRLVVAQVTGIARGPGGMPPGLERQGQAPNHQDLRRSNSICDRARLIRNCSHPATHIAERSGAGVT